MKCPACEQSLTKVMSLKMPIWLCQSCRGIWFDQGVLPVYVKTLCESDRIKPAKTEYFKRRDVQIQAQSRLPVKTCPQCQVSMRVFNYAYDSNVFVDKCPTCEGIWTDHGEVVRIAQHLKEDPKAVSIGSAIAQEVQASQKIQNLSEPGTRTRHSFLRFMFLPKFILPLKDNECCSIIPWVTFTLIGICCVVFGLELFYVQDGTAFLERFAFVPANFWSLGLFTSMFLHDGFFHLLGNMFFLWMFGDNVEDELGSLKFLGLYFLCGLTATLCHLITNWNSQTPCLGASGAIAGVMGAYAILFPNAWIKTYIWGLIVDIPAILFLLGWFGIQILLSRLSDPDQAGIAWFAHIGGFACGLICALGYKFIKRSAQV